MKIFDYIPSLVAQQCDQINTEIGEVVKETRPIESLRTTVYSMSPSGEVVIHRGTERRANARAFAMDYRSRQ
jgi:hypothetical protein